MVARLAVESVAVVVVKHGSDVEVRAVEAVDGVRGSHVWCKRCQSEEYCGCIANRKWGGGKVSENTKNNTKIDVMQNKTEKSERKALAADRRCFDKTND